MRKIILNIAVSLDGFIEGPNGEFDWCFTDRDYGMTEFLKSIDTIFFGRKSYELVSRAEQDFYAGMKKYVFSRTLKEAEGYTIINNNIKQKVTGIKNQKGKDIWLFGGADLVGSFLNDRLIDEMSLAVHPLLLGSGKPLFRNLNDLTNLKLVDTKNYSSGWCRWFMQCERIDLGLESGLHQKSEMDYIPI